MFDENSTEQIRLFVAITVPDVVREEMIHIQRELQPLVPRGAVRWARPEQFHLTLRFLGNVPANRKTELQETIRIACSDVPVLHLRARGLGFFPHARSPRVLWVGVNDDANQLGNLQGRIEDAVRPFTEEPGNERFAGHLTLGRFKPLKRLDIDKLAVCAEAMKERPFGNWRAPQIDILRSELSPTGARHSILASIQLG